MITLVVSSLASAAAAVVVHALWPQATLIGAAATPVLVALFAELLHRPVQRLAVSASVRSAGRLAVDGAGAVQEIRVYRARPRWLTALTVAVAAFALGAGGLTAAEALLQRSVAGRTDSTTLFGRGGTGRAAPVTRQPTTTVETAAPSSDATTTTTTVPRARRHRATSRAPLDRAGRRQRAGAARPAPEPSSSVPQAATSPTVSFPAATPPVTTPTTPTTPSP